MGLRTAMMDYRSEISNSPPPSRVLGYSRDFWASREELDGGAATRRNGPF
jgi:hypothetical protein